MVLHITGKEHAAIIAVFKLVSPGIEPPTQRLRGPSTTNVANVLTQKPVY